MAKEVTYFVVNLEKVSIEKGHPYTLIFEGYVPTYGGNKLYKFKYDGELQSDFPMIDRIKDDFENQLMQEYGSGRMFDIKEVRKKLKEKSQYRMEL